MFVVRSARDKPRDDTAFLTHAKNPQIFWGQDNGNNPVNNGGLSRKHIIEGPSSVSVLSMLT